MISQPIRAPEQRKWKPSLLLLEREVSEKKDRTAKMNSVELCGSQNSTMDLLIYVPTYTCIYTHQHTHGKTFRDIFIFINQHICTFPRSMCCEI